MKEETGTSQQTGQIGADTSEQLLAEGQRERFSESVCQPRVQVREKPSMLESTEADQTLEERGSI